MRSPLRYSTPPAIHCLTHLTWASSDSNVIAFGSAGLAITRRVGTAGCAPPPIRCATPPAWPWAPHHCADPLTPDTLTTVPGGRVAEYSFVHALDQPGADWYASRGTWTTSIRRSFARRHHGDHHGYTGWAVIRVK